MASLLFHELSCFRDIVLPYYFRMLLHVLWEDNIFFVSNFFGTLFCTIYQKEHIFKYNKKGVAVLVLFSLSSNR